MRPLINLLIELSQPLSLAWLLFSLWLLAALVRRRPGTRLLRLAWLALTLASCTPLPSWLLARLENHHPAVRLEDLPKADFIVCLGGGMEPGRREPTGIHLTGGGADRLSTALALAVRRQAPALILGGGGSRRAGKTIAQADAIAAELARIAPLPVETLSLGLCADTHDEAVRAAALAQKRGWKKVLLVTSASHMPRAAATFAKTGLQVIAVPCSYESSFNRSDEVSWLHLPHAGGFSIYAAWLHEMLGLAAYRWRGWI
jgi:uncharacterized SAM-binding protein YcdF (DUF218 family)